MNLFQNKQKLFDSFGVSNNRIGKSIADILFLSPADERFAFKRTLCLSIEKGEVSAAVGYRFLSRITIKGLKKYPLPETDYPSPEFLASSLVLAQAELGAERCHITLSLPKAWVVIKTVAYPPSVLENLSDVVSYELDRITPFNPETAYYDFKILKEDAEEITLLVTAARAGLIDPYLKAIREKGLKVDQITINLLGMSTLSRYIKKTNDSFFIGTDENQYEGALFLSAGALEIFSGSFLSGDEKIKIEQINREIESLKSILGEKDQLGEAVFYLKDKSPSFKEKIRSQIRRPVEFLEESDTGLQILGREQKQVPYTAIGGIMESLWIKSIGLNLLLKGLHKRPKSSWAVTILLVLTLVVLLGIYWVSPVEIEKKRLQQLEKQIALKKVEVRKVDSLKKEIARVSEEIGLINNFKQSKPLALNILKELTMILPKNSWLTRVRTTESQVSIEGYAPSASSLIPRLEDSKLFMKVEFAAPTFRDPNQNLDRFQIKMEIESR